MDGKLKNWNKSLPIHVNNYKQNLPKYRKAISRVQWNYSILIKESIGCHPNDAQLNVKIIIWSSLNQMNCKNCNQNFTTLTRSWSLCIECWITKFNVEPTVATNLRNGEYLNEANCNECKRLNRIYCPDCVD